MKKETIYIKNMCCQRCIEAVQQELSSLGLKVETVKLGEAIFNELVSVSIDTISDSLKKRGFELIVSEGNRIVEAVKIAIIELIHQTKNNIDFKIQLSEYLEEKIKKPYRYIHKLFLEHSQLTIEKYAILQRIEKVKELIEEGRFSFSEIAHITGYKTQQHLSAQFKKNIGMNMIDYKNSKTKNRKGIDQVI